MFNICNRRYTGSKYKLLDWIESNLLACCHRGGKFFDVFAGTGCVSERMQKHFDSIIINDLLFSNNIIYKAFWQNTPYRSNILAIYEDKYNNLKADKLVDNYFSVNFGGKYFSFNDAKITGAIREDIASASSEGIITERETNILIASLLYSVDRISNTVGHYDSYIKTEKINDRFQFKLISLPKISTERESLLDQSESATKFEIYRQDANKLAREVYADVAFVDPPYNSRQYSRFYHILENLAKWEKPQLHGVARKPPVENMSEYCRNNAPCVFADLIEHLQASFIAVTYNNTFQSRSSSSRNKISLKEIEEILSSRGETKIIATHHRFFTTGNTDFDDHKEYLFITKVNK